MGSLPTRSKTICLDGAPGRQKNAEWSYQYLLDEFIQTTHQASLKILAKTLLDESFGQLGTNTTTSADSALLAQVTL